MGYILENIGTIVVVGILVVIVTAIVLKLIRDRKKGGCQGCGCDCAGCGK